MRLETSVLYINETKQMPANFTSGWLGNGERAWHGMGVVTDGSLPAREAFETADALFTVEKRELFYPSAMVLTELALEESSNTTLGQLRSCPN